MQLTALCAALLAAGLQSPTLHKRGLYMSLVEFRYDQLSIGGVAWRPRNLHRPLITS